MNGNRNRGRQEGCNEPSEKPRGAGQGGEPWGGGRGRCRGGAQGVSREAGAADERTGAMRRTNIYEWVETIERRLKALEDRLLGGADATP